MSRQTDKMLTRLRIHRHVTALRRTDYDKIATIQLRALQRRVAKECGVHSAKETDHRRQREKLSDTYNRIGAEIDRRTRNEA